MVKFVFVLYRKPGLTVDEFRGYYEDKHVPLGAKYLGHLYDEYRRMYLDSPDRLSTLSGGTSGSQEGPYPDVITEITVADDDVAEWERTVSNAEIRDELSEDEGRLFDRDLSFMSVATYESGPSRR